MQLSVFEMKIAGVKIAHTHKTRSHRSYKYIYLIGSDTYTRMLAIYLVHISIFNYLPLDIHHMMINNGYIIFLMVMAYRVNYEHLKKHKLYIQS